YAPQSIEVASLINKPAPIFDLPAVESKTIDVKELLQNEVFLSDLTKCIESIKDSMTPQTKSAFCLSSLTRSIDLRYLRGKRTVLTVWSTWSPLAQAQVPAIDEAQRLLGSDARFVLVSLQESSGVVDNYLRRGGYGVTGVLDLEGKFADLYPVLTIPQHFFIDRKGIVRDIFVGFLDKEALIEKVRQL
ncbi:MAG: TlpA disulfide reductase family protein, partial [Patescibacteria group bacterium]